MSVLHALVFGYIDGRYGRIAATPGLPSNAETAAVREVQAWPWARRTEGLLAGRLSAVPGWRLVARTRMVFPASGERPFRQITLAFGPDEAFLGHHPTSLLDRLPAFDSPPGELERPDPTALGPVDPSTLAGLVDPFWRELSAPAEHRKVNLSPQQASLVLDTLPGEISGDITVVSGLERPPDAGSGRVLELGGDEPAPPAPTELVRWWSQAVVDWATGPSPQPLPQLWAGLESIAGTMRGPDALLAIARAHALLDALRDARDADQVDPLPVGWLLRDGQHHTFQRWLYSELQEIPPAQAPRLLRSLAALPARPSAQSAALIAYLVWAATLAGPATPNEARPAVAIPHDALAELGDAGWISVALALQTLAAPSDLLAALAAPAPAAPAPSGLWSSVRGRFTTAPLHRSRGLALREVGARAGPAPALTQDPLVELFKRRAGAIHPLAPEELRRALDGLLDRLRRAPCSVSLMQVAGELGRLEPTQYHPGR